MDMSYLMMLDDYEDRKVARYNAGELCIDTVRVTDAIVPFETGIQHPGFNDNKWVIVAEYVTFEAALAGHKSWVEIMTTPPLPRVLRDVSSAANACLLDETDGTGWRDRTNETNTRRLRWKD